MSYEGVSSVVAESHLRKNYCILVLLPLKQEKEICLTTENQLTSKAGKRRNVQQHPDNVTLCLSN